MSDRPLALVTGGATGIGAACCRQLAQLSPEPTPTSATSFRASHLSQCIETTEAALAPAVLPYQSTL